MSQWGRLLLNEVEKTCVEQDSAVAWSIGGAGLFFKTSSSYLLIDPFFGSSASSDWVRMIAVPLDPEEIGSATYSCRHMSMRIIVKRGLFSQSPGGQEPGSSGRSHLAAGFSSGEWRRTGLSHLNPENPSASRTLM